MQRNYDIQGRPGGDIRAFPDGGMQELELHLRVTDPEVLAELRRFEGDALQRHALAALRLGVLSIRHASGNLDAAAIRESGQHMLNQMRELLTARATDLTGKLTGELSRWFDPNTGNLTQRLAALTQPGGDLERVLRQHLGPDESTLARTLAEHVGDDSELFRLLDPQEQDGLRAQLTGALAEALKAQREQVLREFSKDNPDSALNKMIALLAGTSDQIHRHLTLDDEQSALSRLKRELAGTIERLAKDNQAFQTRVGESLAALFARREEALRSTRHGETFEAQVCEVLAKLAARQGDLCEAVGTTTGTIKHSKKGDCVIELGRDSAAAGARIVIEAKQEQRRSIADALQELQLARKNRDAQIGVFVFSQRVAPAGIEPLARHGQDIVVVWDADEPQSDVQLRAAISIARALCVRSRRDTSELQDALLAMTEAVRGIERQLQHLDQFKTMGETVQNHGRRIAERAIAMRDELETLVQRLDDELSGLRQERSDGAE